MSNQINQEQLLAKVLEINKFKELNPVQKEAFEKDAFNKNLIISSPTSSGKTLVAEISSLNTILNKGKKVMYTCPLKALAFEHYSEFKLKYSRKFKIKAALSTGDLDSSSKYLINYDAIFTTYEKIDSLTRHGASWLKNVGLLVIDEIHEIGSNRGATLEIVISKLRILNPDIQIIALSATIPNLKEIAEWLSADFVKSDFRPVALKEGILLEESIEFKDGSLEKINNSGEPIEEIMEDTLTNKGRQCLVSVNSRKSAVAYAKKLSSITEKILSKKEKKSLELCAEKILNVLEQPTEQCKMLADLVKQGSSFHHAGIMRKQLSIIEKYFKEKNIKVIVATPTLNLGVNIPAYRVIIPSAYRYSEQGMIPISVREYHQIIGRAGRPKYDSEGQGILIAKNENDKQRLIENYLFGLDEEVLSQLGLMPVLRMHLLGLISTNFIKDYESAKLFFEKTLYAKQYADLSSLETKLKSVIGELNEFKFIEVNENKFRITLLGKRVSELYLDPVSAKNIIECIPKINNESSAMFTISNTGEFSPWFSVSKIRESEILIKMFENKNLLPIFIEEQQMWDINLLQKYYSSLLLLDWINEKAEQELLEHYNIQPGILHSKLLICDWIAYSIQELANVIGENEKVAYFSQIRKRLKYGIKSELLELVELKGIGRIRARRLFKAGIKGISDLKKTDIKDVEIIVGKQCAESAFEQLHLNKQ